MRLQFKTRLLTADLNLHRRITLLEGNSGSGKTFLISQLDKFIQFWSTQGKTTEELIAFNSLIILNAHSTPGDYAKLRLPGKNLVIIDNCDYLMHRDTKLLYETIIDENHNWYILCGRCLLYVPLPNDCFAEVNFNPVTKIFTLGYKDGGPKSDSFQETNIC